jgi:hypothetical protein
MRNVSVGGLSTPDAGYWHDRRLRGLSADRTARTTLKLHMYERRVEILRGVLAALGGVFREGRVPGETIPDLLRATSEKDYLLRKDLIEYLDGLYRKAVHGYTLHLEFNDLADSPERTKLVNEHAEVIRWLTEQPAELRRRFIPYLKLSDDEL